MNPLFPSAVSGWSKAKLRYCIEGSQNGSWGEEPGSSEKDVACVRVADFLWDRLALDFENPTIRSITDDQFRKLALRRGDLLLEKSGGGEKSPVGRIVRFDSDAEAICSNFIARVRPREGIFPNYLLYLWSAIYMSKWSHQFIKQNTGIQNLDDHALLDTWLQVPQHRTQRTIADFLDRETARIDQLIEKKELLVNTLNERNAALVAQTVTGDFSPGRPQVLAKDDWVASVPIEWSIRRVRDVAASLQTGPFGSQLHSHEYVQNGIPVVNPSHLVGGRVVPDPNVTVDSATWNRLARHALEQGDIVFARRGDLGRCALITEEEAGWLCGTGSLRMRPNRSLVYPEYLVHLLSTSGVAQWLKLESIGSTMENLNTAILGRLPLPIPPLEVQRRLSAHLDAELARSGKVVELEERSIARLRELRSALITAAVTGQIDVATWGKWGETERRLEAIEHALEADPEVATV